MGENQVINMQNGNNAFMEDLFVQNLNNDNFLQDIFHNLQQINPRQFNEMDFNTFRNRIQQDVIQNNHQGVIDRFREFIGGQEVALEIANVAVDNVINGINLDNIVNQLRNTFYKMDSLSKEEYENKYINKQIKIIERDIIRGQQDMNKLCKRETKMSKDMLKYDKKISELTHDTVGLQTYKQKLMQTKSELCNNVLVSINDRNIIINILINQRLNNMGHGLNLPEDLERGYEPNFINKLQISRALKDTEKTFNKVKSAIDEIDMELQEVNRQITSMN